MSIDLGSGGVRRMDVPRTILHGAGCRDQLPSIAFELGCKRVLIVTDPGLLELGVVEPLRDRLSSIGIEVAVFSDVQPDPTDRNVENGCEALKAHEADGVVAIGGGSPLDAAKVIALRQSNPQPFHEMMGLHKIKMPGVPLIAVPTTAGTGSEATKVAVITDTDHDIKMMMLSAPLLPTAAIVDYELTLSMPASLTAAVGVDTLTHGLEAYISRKANPMTDPIALKCIELCAKHLLDAYRDPDNHEAREGMMLAATLGGMAFSNSSVCLVHGMSRPIGAIFHLPHGLSNAVLLPTVTRYTLPSAIERFAKIARTVGCASDQLDDASAGQALLDWIEQLNECVEIPRLAQCKNVSNDRFEREVEKMAADAIASGSPSNNPRVPTQEEIVQLYRDAL